MEAILNTRPLREKDEVRKLLSLQNGNVSNCFWTLSEAEKAAQGGKIYLLESRNGMAWIRKEAARNQFYFRVPSDQIDSFFCGLPAGFDYAAEIVYLSGQSQKHINEKKVLLNCGFESDCTTHMLSLNADNLQSRDTAGIRPAGHSDYEQVLNLLLASFDPLTDAIPTGAELMDCIEEGKIWIKEESFQSVTGCVMLDTAGKRTWIRHLAVDNNHRRQGIAKALLNFALSGSFLPENPAAVRHEFALWVKSSNSAAIHLYTGMGFKSSNREMEIWTKKSGHGAEQK